MWIKFKYLLNNKKSFWLVSFSMFFYVLGEFCDLALVDTWRFSKSTWSLDREGTWKSRWGLLTLTHNPTKFNGHWRCETRDAHFYEYNAITLQMSQVTQWLWSIPLKTCLAEIGGHIPSKGGDKDFFKITRSHDQWVTWLDGLDILDLNHKGYSKSNRTL